MNDFIYRDGSGMELKAMPTKNGNMILRITKPDNCAAMYISPSGIANLRRWLGAPLAAENEQAEKTIAAVCACFNIKPERLKKKAKNEYKDVFLARHICMYLMSTRIKMTYAAIGTVLGRSLETVYYGYHRIESLMKTSEALSNTIKNIQEQIDNDKEADIDGDAANIT